MKKKLPHVVTAERLEQIFRDELTIEQLTREEFVAVLEHVQNAQKSSMEEATEYVGIKSMTDL